MEASAMPAHHHHLDVQGRGARQEDRVGEIRLRNVIEGGGLLVIQILPPLAQVSPSPHMDLHVSGRAAIHAAAEDDHRGRLYGMGKGSVNMEGSDGKVAKLATFHTTCRHMSLLSWILALATSGASSTGVDPP